MDSGEGDYEKYNDGESHGNEAEDSNVRADFKEASASQYVAKRKINTPGSSATVSVKRNVSLTKIFKI